MDYLVLQPSILFNLALLVLAGWVGYKVEDKMKKNGENSNGSSTFFI